MTSLLPIGLVATGGAVGAVARFMTMSIVGKLFGHGFPYGTITVNVIGSVFMGILVGSLAKYLSDSHQNIHLFLAVGMLGSFTTFSTFSLDTVTLIERGEILHALVYILLSMICSIGGLFLGLIIMRAI